MVKPGKLGQKTGVVGRVQLALDVNGIPGVGLSGDFLLGTEHARFAAAGIHQQAQGERLTGVSLVVLDGLRLAVFKNLELIFRWKTNGRGISRLGINSDEEIADALHLVTVAKTERSAITAPCGLYGVEVPVASAILTAINPERYTVIDFRALEALGTDTTDRTIDFYLFYLAACRDWAIRYGANLRDFDRALWQWSSSHRESRK